MMSLPTTAEKKQAIAANRKVKMLITSLHKHLCMMVITMLWSKHLRTLLELLPTTRQNVCLISGSQWENKMAHDSTTVVIAFLCNY